MRTWALDKWQEGELVDFANDLPGIKRAIRYARIEEKILREEGKIPVEDLLA